MRGVPVVGVENGLKVGRMRSHVGQDAQELEVQSLAEAAEIAEGVGFGVDGLAALRIFIHTADDVETGRVLEVLGYKRVRKYVVNDVW